MNSRISKPVARTDLLFREIIAAARETNDALKIGRRGVYLIGGNAKIRSFRLVPWEHIRKQLQS